MKKLPIGVQHFPKLIENGYQYVDKTEFIWKLISKGDGYFFSRPRRFGKSLLLSTIASLFRGKKDLFKGLWIESVYEDWTAYPVVHLDLSRVYAHTSEMLAASLNKRLVEAAKENDLDLQPDPYPAETFSSLIFSLAKKREVVILIDEYDHPLLNNVNDTELTDKNRDILNDFFTVIKSLSQHIRFALVTGVSKFSKVSLFSGMNNLWDISLNSDYATLAGISEKELDQYYSEYIQKVSSGRNETIQETRDKMREWYNGYCFSNNTSIEKVYNPVSVHLFLARGLLIPFWFSTATPTFAIQLVQQQNFPIIDLEEGVSIGASIEEHHEVHRMNLIPLLYQTGYLTITDFDEERGLYVLKFPNYEVRQSFLEHLLQGLSELDNSQLEPHLISLRNHLESHDFDAFFNAINSLFAEIPYPLHVAKEAYYHSLIYLILRALNLQAEPEVLTSHGRLDLAITTSSAIFIVEFKINDSAKNALDQIHTKAYHKRYLNKGKSVILLGVNIDSQQRTITEWESSAG